MASFYEDSLSFSSDYSEITPIRYAEHMRQDNRNRRYGNMKGGSILIVVTVLERCSYYALVSNLPFTLSRWFRIGNSASLSKCPDRITKQSTAQVAGHMDTMKVILILLFFYLLSSLFSVVGGWLGDSRLGRSKTLRLSFVFYIAGTATFMLLMWVMGCNQEDFSKDNNGFCKADTLGYMSTTQICIQWVLLLFSLICCAIGYGLYKPNIAPFGADQMREFGQDTLQKFYLGFYFCTNVGSIGGFFVGFMQAQDSTVYTYTMSFSVCVICSISCLILLIAGSRCRLFTEVQPSEDRFSVAIKFVKEYVKQRYTYNDAIIRETGTTRVELMKVSNGGGFGDEQVDSLMDLLRIVPILLTMIIYWTIYSQFFSMYYFQAFYLQRPASWPLSVVQLLNPFTILILVPLLNHVIYPLLRRHNLTPHAFTRMMLGFGLAGLSLVCAVVVAVQTRTQTLPQYNPIPRYYFHQEDNIEYVTYTARNMTIALLAPQILLMSVSEVFAIIASMEFVYTEAPKFMKSFAMGLYFLIQAFGDCLAIILILVTKVVTERFHSTLNYWICNNINDGQIDNYFLLLLFLLVANMVLLWRRSIWFQHYSLVRYYNC